jgi:hypothetical protein
MTPAAKRSQQEVERELEKIERFRRVASRRANNALKNMEALIRTSNRSNYSYTDEQVAEVIGKLRQATDQLAAAYAGSAGASLKVEL